MKPIFRFYQEVLATALHCTESGQQGQASSGPGEGEGSWVAHWLTGSDLPHTQLGQACQGCDWRGTDNAVTGERREASPNM